MKDKIIEANGKKYSLRKCLGEMSWSRYLNASKKVQDLTENILKLQLKDMGIDYASMVTNMIKVINLERSRNNE